MRYLVLLLLPFLGQSQESKIKVISNLDDFKEIWSDKSTWSLAHDGEDSTYTPIDYLKIGPYVKNMVKNNKYYISSDFTDIRDKNINGIDSFYMLFPLFGQDQIAKYLTNKGFNVPFKIFTRSNNSYGILFHGIYIDKIYNTQKFTSNQMAAKVISQYALPSLERANMITFSNDVTAIGMAFVYGSQDLVKNRASDLQQELVIAIFPIDIIKKYLKGQLTDAELADESEFFISNRDMILAFKKLKLTIE